MRNLFVCLLALTGGYWLCAQTPAQSPPGELPALSGASANSDTTILSDNGFEGYYRLKTYIYHGNVRAFNAQMKLRCELLTVELPDVGEGKFNRVTAETNVVIDWVDEHGTNHATADKAVYTYVVTNLATLPETNYQTNSTVVLTGIPYAHATFGQEILDGNPIVWDRIKDSIYTPNLKQTVIKSTTNIFEGGIGPKTNDAPKTNSSTK
jgi:hypothetical protein